MTREVSGGIDCTEVRTWLKNVESGEIGELTAHPIAGGRSNPTYELTDGTRHWILRRPPQGHVLPTAHDMGREYRAMSSLKGTAVPVPRTVGLCEDPSVIGASFYVMDKIDGITLRTQTDTEQLTVAQRSGLATSMIETLAELHSIDPAAVGLGDWGKPEGFLERQLRRWKRQWDSSATSDRPEISELHQRLTKSLPAREYPGIVHGDFKIDNMMVDRSDPTRILGVLDWEMSTLGDTLTDLGVMCSFWDQEGEFYNPITAGATALPGFPRRNELVERYIAARGIDVPEIDWYLVFADFKIAVILEGIHARHLKGHTEGADFAGVGEMVGPLLDRALEYADRSNVAALAR